MRGLRAPVRSAARSFRPAPYDGLVAAALESVSRRARLAGSNTWDVRLSARQVVRATVQAEWLVLESEPPRRVQNQWKREYGAAALLRRHRALPGNVKFVLGDAMRASPLRLRAEVPLPDHGQSEADSAEPFAVQVDRAIDSIGAAHSLEPTDATKSSESEELSASAGNGAGVLPAVATMCAEAGWVVQGTTAAPRVTLAADGFRQAVVSSGPGPHDIRLLLNLYDDLPEVSVAVSQRAAALLLLRTGSVVRLVRPLIAEPQEEIGYEVRLTRPPAESLVHALNALSLAARHSAMEAEALADPRLAAAYVASFDNEAAHHTLTKGATWATG